MSALPPISTDDLDGPSDDGVQGYSFVFVTESHVAKLREIAGDRLTEIGDKLLFEIIPGYQIELVLNPTIEP